MFMFRSLRAPSEPIHDGQNTCESSWANIEGKTIEEQILFMNPAAKSFDGRYLYYKDGSKCYVYKYGLENGRVFIVEDMDRE